MLLTLLPLSTRPLPPRSHTLPLVTAPKASARALLPGLPGAGKIFIANRAFVEATDRVERLK